MNIHQDSISARIVKPVMAGIRNSIRTISFLLSITIPVSFVVSLLSWSGVISTVSKVFEPLFRVVGLPGEAAPSLLSGIFLNNYSAIAALQVTGLNIRQATLVAIMTLTCHNLFIETPVMKRSGSSMIVVILLRLSTALLLGWILNVLLPQNLGRSMISVETLPLRLDFVPMLSVWFGSIVLLSGKMVLIVIVIMVLQRILEEFQAMNFLSRLLSPLMILFGLPLKSSFLWLVINTVGYAYGAGVVIAEIEDGKMSKQDGDLFNRHAAICHSLLEDTILFGVLGVPILWIVVPRLLAAMLSVWLERARRTIFRRSFRVGTV